MLDLDAKHCSAFEETYSWFNATYFVWPRSLCAHLPEATGHLFIFIYVPLMTLTGQCPVPREIDQG